MEEIVSAIVSRENELKNEIRGGRIIEREIKVEPSNEFVNIITGVRRCGKSTLAFLLTREYEGAYINFEDERLQLKLKDLAKILDAVYSLKKNVEFLVFDEIQYIDGWERFVARLLPGKKRKIIVTGSNAQLMSREFGTFLTGRHIDFELFPFSFREYLRFNKFAPNEYLTSDAARTKRLLEEYMEKGGFPEAYVREEILPRIYGDIIERDVRQRYAIKYTKELSELARYYVKNFGREISFRKLANVLDIKSVHTIKNYSHYLATAYLFFFLEKYSPKLKESMIAPKKVYCIDTGIINTMCPKDYGRLMENIVAIELFRMRSYWNKDMEIYYWRELYGEVDFVVKDKSGVKDIIQVTYASGRDEIERREIRSLLKAADLFGGNLVVITWDYADTQTIDGKKIVFIPLWRWLLKVGEHEISEPRMAR